MQLVGGDYDDQSDRDDGTQPFSASTSRSVRTNGGTTHAGSCKRGVPA